MTKAKKTDKKDQRLSVNAFFDELIKASVAGNPKPKAKPLKKVKK